MQDGGWVLEGLFGVRKTESMKVEVRFLDGFHAI